MRVVTRTVLTGQAAGALVREEPPWLPPDDAKDEEVLQLVPTFNVPAVTTGPVASQHPAGTAHSVAVDAKNNHVFVPLAANNV